MLINVRLKTLYVLSILLTAIPSGGLSRDCSKTVKSVLVRIGTKGHYYIDQDKEWGESGTLTFSPDLQCRVVSSGREICDNEKSYSQPLMPLKIIIMDDAEKMIHSHRPLGKKIRKYREVFIDMNFQNKPYSALFNYLFLLNDYMSRKKVKRRYDFSQILRVKVFCFDRKTLIFYNNMAYFIQKVGAYRESIHILEQIVARFPNRDVAWLNLGDAYWAVGEKAEAQVAYQTYINLMRKKGLSKRIPTRVFNRLRLKTKTKDD